MSESEDKTELDSLLNEYQEENQSDKNETQQTTQSKQKTQPTAQPDTDTKEVIEYVKQEQRRKYDEEVNGLATEVRGEIKVSDKIARAFIEAEASTDQAISNAWINRFQNPAAWNKAKEVLQNRFKEQFKNDDIDQKATQDTQEMLSAVTNSSSSKKTPEQPPKFEKMTDSDFSKMWNELV